MIEIIPAIMPSSFDDLTEKISKLVGVVETAQIDLMDGKFVNSVSWPYKEGDSIPALIPNANEIDFEIDLMVESPTDVAGVWARAGAKRLVPHLESLKNPKEELMKMRHSGVELGVAINIDTQNNELEEVMDLVDFVQFMGIARIGYQGEVFDERTIEKIISFRSKYPEIIISVDGGVNLESAPALIDAGANRLVSGSLIWKSGNIKETVESLKNL
ncbi:MAG: hypothetical protein ISR99_02845 [Parcubacteria group bacterium]|nr:hypothetical protein [Parcubacteria group bacterium]